MYAKEIIFYITAGYIVINKTNTQVTIKWRLLSKMTFKQSTGGTVQTCSGKVKISDSVVCLFVFHAHTGRGGKNTPDTPSHRLQRGHTLYWHGLDRA